MPFFLAGSGFDSPEVPCRLLCELPSEHVGKGAGYDFGYLTFAFSHIKEPTLTAGHSSDIAFTVENWPKIRRRLIDGYVLVVRRSLALANWVRQQIQGRDEVLIPRVRKVGERTHNRVEVEISQAGFGRTLELTNKEAELLEGLARDGTYTTYRKTKKRLVDNLPELCIWIENRPREANADPNEATYGVCQEVQEAIAFGEGNGPGNGARER